MRPILQTSALLLLAVNLTACGKTDKKQVDEKPAFQIAGPQREQLQKAKELEKQMQQDAENQRKVIELQTNPK
jgi:hypothetical protein